MAAELATLWHSVSSLVAKPQCNCDAAQHNTLQCLINMATELQDDAEDGATKQPSRFAVGLQGRLWSKVQKTAAMSLESTTVELWSKTVPHTAECALVYDGYW